MNAPRRFDPESVGRFRVVDRTFDRSSRTVSLGYALDDQCSFTERITFETPTGDDTILDGPGLERALLHLHIAAGTSYYKVAAPARVVVEDEALTPMEREFHRHLYDDGLREFAVANGMEVPRRVELLAADTQARRAPPEVIERRGGLLVPIGGGKDSMVLIDAVKHLRPRLFAVNPHPLVLELARQSGLDMVVVRRTLSPQLPALNRSGALNGHIPITAILSLVAVVGSFLYGYDTIAMAVERSASEETMLVDGVPVNHQYSKSLEFERLLQQLIVASIDSGLTYGSALRPYSELAIARAFARLTDYHATFCSCNTAYRQSSAADSRWCGNCPKCRFVGLMLAPFMHPVDVTAIIGRDMFADPDQIGGFAALMSNEDKPFECVGERRESAAALRLLSSLPAWRATPVVRALAARAEAMVTEADVGALLIPMPGLAFADVDVAAAVQRALSEVP